MKVVTAYDGFKIAAALTRRANLASRCSLKARLSPSNEGSVHCKAR